MFMTNLVCFLFICPITWPGIVGSLSLWSCAFFLLRVFFKLLCSRRGVLSDHGLCGLVEPGVLYLVLNCETSVMHLFYITLPLNNNIETVNAKPCPSSHIFTNFTYENSCNKGIYFLSWWATNLYKFNKLNGDSFEILPVPTKLPHLHDGLSTGTGVSVRR